MSSRKKAKIGKQEQVSLWIQYKPLKRIFKVILNSGDTKYYLDHLHDKIAAQVPLAIHSYGFSVDCSTGKKKYFCSFDRISETSSYVSEENPLSIELHYPIEILWAHPVTFNSVDVKVPFEAVNKAENYSSASETLKVLSECFSKKYSRYHLQIIDGSIDSSMSFYEIFGNETIALAPVYTIQYTITKPVNYADDLTRYKKVAAILCTDPFVVDLKRYLLTNSEHYDIYQVGNIETRVIGTFTCVVLPSMTGKTQVALSLGYGAFYFNFSCKSQPIYSAFEFISQQLIEVANLDLNSFSTEGIVTCEMIKDHFLEGHRKSYLGGFILELIKKFGSQDPSCTAENWIDFCSSLRISSAPAYESLFMQESVRDYRNKLIFILDEFPSMKAQKYSFAAVYIRNYLRYLGLSGLVMGTNTKIYNLIGDASGSSEKLEPRNDLIFKLPSANLDALLSIKNIDPYFRNYSLLNCEGHEFEIIDDARNFAMNIFCSKWCNDQYARNDFEVRAIKLFKVLVDQIKSSRPGIGFIIASNLSLPLENRVSLDSEERYSNFTCEIFLSMSNRIFGRKRVLREVKSINGHLALMMSNYISPNPRRLKAIANLVNSHLFYLGFKHFNGNFIFFGNEKIGLRIYTNTATEMFFVKPEISFEKVAGGSIPSPSEELLTFFASFWGFETEERTYPTPSFSSFKNLREIEDKYSSMFNQKGSLDSSATEEVPWNKSECITIVSISLASHSLAFSKSKNGNQFMDTLLCHFISFQGNKNWTSSCPALESYLALLTVPYLGPCNNPWPSDLDGLLPCKLGTAFRIGGNAINDIAFDVIKDGNKSLAAVECKLRKEPIGHSRDQGLCALIRKSRLFSASKGKDCGLHLIFCRNTCTVNYLRGNETFQDYISEIKQGVFLVNFEDNAAIPLNTRDIDHQFESVTIIIPIFNSLFPNVKCLVLSDI